MLSEEEKKAIDNLFHLQHISTYLDLHTKENFKIKTKTLIKWKQSIDTLIHYVNELQNENKRLNKELSKMLKEKEYDVYMIRAQWNENKKNVQFVKLQEIEKVL